jgi:hypothetical protein
VTVTAAASNDGTVMVFVDSELLGNLVLTVGEAAALSTALAQRRRRERRAPGRRPSVRGVAETLSHVELAA